MSKDEWFKELKQEGILDILFALLYQKESLNLETNFYEASQDYTKEIIIKGKLPDYYLEDWEILLKALKLHLRNTLIMNIIDELIHNSQSSRMILI